MAQVVVSLGAHHRVSFFPCVPIVFSAVKRTAEGSLVDTGGGGSGVVAVIVVVIGAVIVRVNGLCFHAWSPLPLPLSLLLPL